MTKVAIIGNAYAGKTAAALGKIEDAGDLVMGGRVDTYWVNDPEMKAIDKKISDADKVHTETYTADQNEFIDVFGFKSVEFGNWLNQPERYYFLYNTAVSFKHLSDIFSISPYLIGFNKKLSVAFGARGKTRAMAHYERLPNIIINLTKEHGHHSLAHEYGHAIDNLLGYYIGRDENSYISGGRSVRKNVDDELLLSENYFIRKSEALFKALYYNKDGSETSFLATIKNHSQADYLTRRTEVFARTFEVYIARKLDKAGIKNTFLVKEKELSNIYPVKLMDKVEPIMDSIINNAFKVFEDKKLQKEVQLKDTLGAIEVLGQNKKKLNYNGFQPTYQQLGSFGSLIVGADSPNVTRTVANGGLDETIKVIKDVIKNYNYQVEPLAQHLKADTLEQSSFNIWHFIKKNIRYDFDLAGKEEIRTPARAWKDRFNRSDCEDYSIFAASLLLNMGYSPTLRIVAFGGKDYFQHIYITINGITIDAVLNKFNKEPDNISDVMDIQVLNGLGETPVDTVRRKLMNDQTRLIKMARCKKHRGRKPQLKAELRKIRYMLLINGTQESKEIMPVMSSIKDITSDGKFIFKKDADIAAITDYLTKVKNTSDKSLSGLGATSFKNSFLASKLSMLFDRRDWIAEQLSQGKFKGSRKEKAEQLLSEINDLITNNGVDGLGASLMDIIKAKAEANKKVEQTFNITLPPDHGKSGGILDKVGDFVKSAGGAVKDVAGKIKDVIVKYNPLSVLARNAYLGLLRLNFKGWSEDYALGYANSSVLRSKGYEGGDISKLYQRRVEMEKFWKGVGGNIDSLRKAIQAKGNSAAGLGSVLVAGASTVAAAAPVIAKVKSIVDKYKLAKAKVTSAVNTVKNVKSKATSLIDMAKGAASSIPRPNSATANDTTSKEEIDFINDELYRDAGGYDPKTGFNDKGNEDDKNKSSNTLWWVVGGMAVTGLGLMAMNKMSK